MVNKKQKLRTTQFICDRLEESGRYAIHKHDGLVAIVREKKEVRKNPRTIVVLVANFIKPIGAFTATLRDVKERGAYSAVVVYKDGESAFKRVVDTTRGLRDEKSLKNYTPQQINEMLHLRGIEKVVVEQFGSAVTYYQPESARLQESLRTFVLNPVRLDYSHIRPGHPSYGFVRDYDSVDYKIPELHQEITGAARFVYFSMPDFRASRKYVMIVNAQENEPYFFIR